LGLTSFGLIYERSQPSQRQRRERRRFFSRRDDGDAKTGVRQQPRRRDRPGDRHTNDETLLGRDAANFTPNLRRRTNDTRESGRIEGNAGVSLTFHARRAGTCHGLERPGDDRTRRITNDTAKHKKIDLSGYRSIDLF
jgi:hypothetical protein